MSTTPPQPSLYNSQEFVNGGLLAKVALQILGILNELIIIHVVAPNCHFQN
jgi:hypothetical protein